MNFRTTLAISVTIVVLMTLLESGGAHNLLLSMRIFNLTDHIAEKSSFNCSCDGEPRFTNLGIELFGEIFKSLQNWTLCTQEKTWYCEWLDECESCIGVMETCSVMTGTGKGFNCTTEVFEKREELLNGTLGQSGLKQRRQVRECITPTGLRTASMSVVRYSDYVLFRQKCIYGHTLKEGIFREMRCLYSENKWDPGFEECFPFVNCSIKLRSPGTVECSKATPEKPQRCRIICYAHGHIRSRAKKAGDRTHECDAHRGWVPRLPSCVTQTGFELVPAPEIRIHATEEPGTVLEREPEMEPDIGPGTESMMESGTESLMGSGTEPMMESGTESMMGSGTEPVMERETDPVMELETERETERKSDREMEREAERVTERVTERNADREMEREIEREMQRRAERKAERKAERELDRELKQEMLREIKREMDRKADREMEREMERKADREME